MLQDLLQRVLAGELNKMGKDGDGNTVISPQSVEELSHKITSIIHDSICRPVVTVTNADILQIGVSAGLRPGRVEKDGVLVQALVDAEGRDQYELVTKVADHSLRFALQAVRDQTLPKQTGVIDG